jgi:anti-anti-sigma factor
MEKSSDILFDSDDFTVDTRMGISIVKINIYRATHRDLNEFMRVLNLILETNPNKIIIDFGDCQFVDSMIIGIMIITVKKVRKFEGDIRLVIPHENIINTFYQTRLDKIFKQFGTLEQALTSFSH